MGKPIFIGIPALFIVSESEAFSLVVNGKLVEYHPDDFVVFPGGILVLMFRSLPPKIHFALHKQ